MATNITITVVIVQQRTGHTLVQLQLEWFLRVLSHHMLLELVRAIAGELAVRTLVQVLGHMQQSVSLQILILTESMAAHFANERHFVAMRGNVDGEILFAPRRVRTSGRWAAKGDSGVTELMGAKRFQVARTVSAFVAQQTFLVGMDEHVVAQTVLPLEAFGAVRAGMGSGLRVFGCVEVQGGFRGESLVAVGAEEGPRVVVVAHQVAPANAGGYRVNQFKMFFFFYYT